MKPVTTGTVPSSITGRRLAAIPSHDWSSGVASPNSSVVTTPTSHASSCLARTPCRRSAAATTRPLNRSPYETTRSRVRGESSPSSATPSNVRSHLSRSSTTSLASVPEMLSASSVSTWSARTVERSTVPSSIARSAAARSPLVVFPMAEHTRQGCTLCSTICARTRDATSAIRSASRTLDPPNFITTLGGGTSAPRARARRRRRRRTAPRSPTSATRAARGPAPCTSPTPCKPPPPSRRGAWRARRWCGASGRTRRRQRCACRRASGGGGRPCRSPSRCLGRRTTGRGPTARPTRPA
mmetsp:Transcript_15421/g.49650  ORF Transcript_15421/g.49650 Transcript_15421/m.49650 type:complete len:298 (-) Transcript_15421:279-1172(-)